MSRLLHWLDMPAQPEIFQPTLPARLSSECVVGGFLSALDQGADWFTALLDAVANWPAAEEERNGHVYRYLVGEEAFNWLLLAERLLGDADGRIPEPERDRLLFSGILPRHVTAEEFRDCIGAEKYRAVVNYWYGVRVEEALVLAVEHEIRKQRRGLLPEEPLLDDSIYEHIYGATQDELLARFVAETGLLLSAGVSLHELEEFTYWLFKLRLKRSDKARLASDTKKGIAFLQQLGRASMHGIAWLKSPDASTG